MPTSLDLFFSNRLHTAWDKERDKSVFKKEQILLDSGYMAESQTDYH